MRSSPPLRKELKSPVVDRPRAVARAGIPRPIGLLTGTVVAEEDSSMRILSFGRSDRHRKLFALLVVGCSALLGCGGGSGGGATAGGRTYVVGSTLNVRSPGDFRLFDPMVAADNTTNMIMANSYATLLYLDHNSKFEGYLARSWKVSPTSVVFTLKSGITCADGTPVTPTVVKNSFQRMFDIKDAYNSILSGPGPYSTSADDAAGTFTFTVGTPYSDLLYSFSQTFPNSHTGIICPAGLKDTSQFPTKM